MILVDVQPSLDWVFNLKYFYCPLGFFISNFYLVFVH